MPGRVRRAIHKISGIKKRLFGSIGRISSGEKKRTESPKDDTATADKKKPTLYGSEAQRVEKENEEKKKAT